MGLLEQVTSGAPWPPPGHKRRLQTQHDLQLLYRNRRPEVAQRYAIELEGHTEPTDAVYYPTVRIAAQLLADFLFGTAPTISSGTLDDEVLGEAFAHLPARLLEGAATCAVQGEVYLRPTWDGELHPWPLLTIVPGRRVIPRFRHGVLAEALVVTEKNAGSQGQDVWRLIEHHHRDGATGVISYSAWEGTDDRLGQIVPLPESPWPDPTGTGQDTISPGVAGLLLHHVPFTRDGEDDHGVSPFDGAEGLILALHRLYSQEQHDAEMARRRVAVPSAYLKRDRRGNPVMDRRTDVFELADEAAGPVGQERPIVPLEFSDDLIDRERIAGRWVEFLTACGIAPQSLGKDAGAAESGTARRLAQALTLRTVGRAGGYWLAGLQPCLVQMLQLARTELGQQVPPGAEVAVSLGDPIGDDPEAQARTLATLDSAEAISTEQKVRRLHPEWDDRQVDTEVAAIEGRRPAPANPPGLSLIPGQEAEAG